MSVSQTHYLRDVVGDTEIRKGDGMELDQLSHNISSLRERNAHIHPFDLDVLWEAFQMRETTPVCLTAVRPMLHLTVFLFKLLPGEGDGGWGGMLLKACSDG